MKEPKRVNIKITAECRGSEDGCTVKVFYPNGGPNGDGVYETTEALAEAFVDHQKTAERTGAAAAVAKVVEAAGEAAGAVAEAVTGKGKRAAKAAEETPTT